MGIGKGDVSHNAVLSDLDLPKGSLRQRAVYNRVGKAGGTMSLSEHRGVACRPQLNTFSLYDQQPNNTNTGYGSYWPAIGSIPSNNYISGDRIVLAVGYSGGGGPPTYEMDASSAHNTNFKVTESGQYRITGKVDWTAERSFSLTFWQIAVTDSATGYLDVPSLPLYHRASELDDSGITDFEQTFDLTTDKPFATLIFYAVRWAGGDPSKPESVAKFYDFEVVKT